VVKAGLLRTDDLLRLDYSIRVSEADIEKMKQALLIELLLEAFHLAYRNIAINTIRFTEL
jgi:hypothetical protein